jgi:meromycolic acid enoyl-[acyl-carrier-protein] reductase
MLTGKRILITGVVNADSIAFATAKRAQELGADVFLTALPRDQRKCEQASRELPRLAGVLPLDATRPEDYDVLAEELRLRWGGVDGALHAVAFAPRDALSGDFLQARPDGVNLAFQTSAMSYAHLGRLVAELAPAGGGSLVGLDFDAGGAWPVYNWMGVCKAALESVNRYLARDLGPRAIRSNLVAAGPLRTRAASGIPDFERLEEAWATTAPMHWDVNDAAPVGDACCFLLSDMARAITGEILHVDGGHHAMAGALRPAAPRPATETPIEAETSPLVVA